MADELRCRRVIARTPSQVGLQPLGVRLRVTHLLATADLRPPGLPPAAVLLIRHLAPGRRLPLGGYRAAVPWENATRSRIAALHRSATRPVRGRVSADAAAVLFQDEAEWLAALAVNARAGWQPWWAAEASDPGVSDGTYPLPIVVRAWLQVPRAIPGAVVQLARWRALGIVLATWPPQASERVLAVLVDTFGLAPGLSRSGTDLTPFVSRDPPGRKAALPLATTQPGPGTAIRERILRELGPLIADSDWRTLPPLAQRLALVACGTASAPLLLRRAEAAEAIMELASTCPSQGQAATSLNLPAMVYIPEPVSRRTSASSSGEVWRAEPAPAAPVVRHHVAQWLRTHTGTLPPPLLRASRSAEGLPPRPGDIHTAAPTAQDVRPHQPAMPSYEPEEGWATDLGGLFLLLDLVVSAQLPDVFAAELDLPQLITGWAILELLGRALLGSLHAKDLAWTAIAHLDGRRPGENPPPLPISDFVIPPSWLPPDDLEWHATAINGWLRLSHPDGDIILERRIVELSASLALAVERGRLGPRVPEDFLDTQRAPGLRQRDVGANAPASPYFTQLPHGWQVFARRVLPCLFGQASRRLSVTPDEAAKLLRAIITRPARLYLTPTHADVVFALADISMEARRAGFDADPGWVRDLMRVIRFHFI
jgi:hypothetical protein